MTWFAANPTAFLPTGVSAGVSATADLIGQYLDTARRGLAIARLYQQSLGADVPDVLGTLIKAIVDTVEGLLQAGKVHVLFVPMAKVVASDSADAVTVPPTLSDVAHALGFRFKDAGISLSSGADVGYSKLVGQKGGSKGFFNTFLQSLTDVLDPNRPQYDDPKDAVVMTVIMAGAPTFSETIEIAAALNRIFRTSGNNDLTSRTIPTPQNLKTKVIAVPKATRVGVRLTWDAPESVVTLPFFPGVKIRVNRYALIRSTSAAAMAAKSVTDFFSTRDLKVGTSSDDQAKASKVIAIGSGANSSYVDDDHLDKSKTYYYCVAWEVEVTESGKTSKLRFDKVSNVAKTRPSTPQQTQNSVPPDWAAYGSLLDLVPDVSLQVKTMLEQLRVVGDRRHGAASRVSRALDLASAQLAEALARVDSLNAAVKRFSAVLGQPLPSLHATTIEGVGGNSFLIGELAARLTDTSDPHRPPFDDHEYVMGLCIVGGGPRLPDIKPIADLLKTLFHPPVSSNPLLGVLAVIDDVVAQQEATFGADLRPLSLNSDGTVTLPNGTTAAPDAVDPGTGQLRIVPLPVIGEGLIPLDTSDPDNPNASDSNNVDLGDLC